MLTDAVLVHGCCIGYTFNISECFTKTGLSRGNSLVSYPNHFLSTNDAV